MLTVRGKRWQLGRYVTREKLARHSNFEEVRCGYDDGFAENVLARARYSVHLDRHFLVHAERVVIGFGRLVILVWAVGSARLVVGTAYNLVFFVLGLG